jgi:hypothetical protein
VSKHTAINFGRCWSQRNALDTARRIGQSIAHQRNEAGVPRSWTERTVWVKPQDLVDRFWQRNEIDAAPLRQILRR